MKLNRLLQKVSHAFEQALADPPSTRRQAPPPPPDAFEVSARAPAAKLEANKDYVKSLYRELLGREPDLDGFVAHLTGLQSGMSRESLRQVFLSSDEYRARQTPVQVTTPPPVEAPPPPPPRIREPGAPLVTVPLKPEYAAAPIDTSSGPAAAKSAAQWVKDSYPQLFGHGDDRQIAFEVMTHVLGAMRAHGFDAHRVVNHPSFPVGHGQRYGSDALVVGGQIFDVYGAFGEPGRSDVQLLNPGPYAADRLRE